MKFKKLESSSFRFGYKTSAFWFPTELGLVKLRLKNYKELFDYSLETYKLQLFSAKKIYNGDSTMETLLAKTLKATN